MRSIFSLLLVLFLGTLALGQTGNPAPSPTPAASPSNSYVFPDAKTRQERYIKSMFGWKTLARQTVTAGVGTWRNSPEEWGDQWEGFGRRMASNLGKNAIKQTTIYGLGEALKLDSHFHKATNRDLGSRVTNALLSPVTARNREGKRVVGVPRLVGTYASNVIAYQTWYPNSHNWKDGVTSGTISLGITAAFNLFVELIHK